MTDENADTSGNRWEPTGQATNQTTGGPTDGPTETGVRRPWLTRARTAIAGSAAVVLLAGGLGGFAIGRATADTDGAGGADQRQGGPAGFGQDGDRGGFPGAPDGSQQGPPPDSQAPGTTGSDT
jgi:hypothetical protein